MGSGQSLLIHMETHMMRSSVSFKSQQQFLLKTEMYRYGFYSKQFLLKTVLKAVGYVEWLVPGSGVWESLLCFPLVRVCLFELLKCAGTWTVRSKHGCGPMYKLYVH